MSEDELIDICSSTADVCDMIAARCQDAQMYSEAATWQSYAAMWNLVIILTSAGPELTKGAVADTCFEQMVARLDEIVAAVGDRSQP